MTLMDCQVEAPPLPTPPMDNEPLQKRAKQAGLAQNRLAALLGVHPNTMSLQLRGKWESGTPRYVIAAIVAWEVMSHEQRMAWIELTEQQARELKRRDA